MHKRIAIGASLRFKILERDNYTCRYCGKHCRKAELHVDHIFPVCLGGTNDPDNLATACKECNLGKSGSVLQNASALFADQPPIEPDPPMRASTRKRMANRAAARQAEEPKKQVTLRLRDSQLVELKLAAIHCRRSMVGLVENLIEGYVAQRRAPAIDSPQCVPPEHIAEAPAIQLRQAACQQPRQLSNAEIELLRQKDRWQQSSEAPRHIKPMVHASEVLAKMFGN